MLTNRLQENHFYSIRLLLWFPKEPSNPPWLMIVYPRCPRVNFSGPLALSARMAAVAFWLLLYRELFFLLMISTLLVVCLRARW